MLLLPLLLPPQLTVNVMKVAPTAGQAAAVPG
jgi:hypothetical protein